MIFSFTPASSLGWFICSCSGKISTSLTSLCNERFYSTTNSRFTGGHRTNDGTSTLRETVELHFGRFSLASLCATVGKLTQGKKTSWKVRFHCFSSSCFSFDPLLTPWILSLVFPDRNLSQELHILTCRGPPSEDQEPSWPEELYTLILLTEYRKQPKAKSYATCGHMKRRNLVINCWKGFQCVSCWVILQYILY